MIRIGGHLPVGQAIIPVAIGTMEDSLKKEIMDRGCTYGYKVFPSKQFEEGYDVAQVMVVNPAAETKETEFEVLQESYPDTIKSFSSDIKNVQTLKPLYKLAGDTQNEAVITPFAQGGAGNAALQLFKAAVFIIGLFLFKVF